MTASLDSKPDYSTYPAIDRATARAAAQQLLALDGEGAPAPDAVWREVERFYAREARLLDAERYSDWYALLADDVFYHNIPMAPVIGLMLLLGLVPQLVVDSVNPTVQYLLAHWRF